MHERPLRGFGSDCRGNVAKGPKDEKAAIKVALLYGREHARQFGDVSAADLAKWMKKSTRSVSAAFVTLHEKLQTEFVAGQAH